METFVYIWLDGAFVPAGRLAYVGDGNEGNSYFAYGRKYLARKNAVAIDPVNLPLEEKQYQADTDFGIFSAIRDAGPDRWGRYLLNKKFNRDLNELEYVLASGADRVGALAFGPDLEKPRLLTPGGYSEYRSKNLNLEVCLKAADDAIANAETEDLRRFLEYGPSLGGARPKASVILNGKPHLAKFSVSLDRRNEPKIEYAAMSLASRCGLDVPPIYLEKVIGRDVYLIERFDRTTFDIHTERKHFISALTAGQLYESGYSNWSYALLCQAIDRICIDPKKDKQELYKRMVFNILVNNNDDHPRNYGFVHAGKDKWKLSPFYDAVPMDQSSNTFRLAMLIGDYGKEASRKNALSAAPYFDLSEKEARDIWQQIEGIVLENWKDVFLSAGLTLAEVKQFQGSIGLAYKD